MPASSLDGQKPSGGQLAKVTAGRGWAHSGFSGQSTGGQRTPVIQGEEDPAASGISYQRAHRGDISITFRIASDDTSCVGGRHIRHGSSPTEPNARTG